jgi:hypothetical protein
LIPHYTIASGIKPGTKVNYDLENQERLEVGRWMKFPVAKMEDMLYLETMA